MVMNEKLFNNLSKYFHGNKKTDKKELVSYFKYKHASSGKLFELQNGLAISTGSYSYTAAFGAQKCSYKINGGL